MLFKNHFLACPANGRNDIFVRISINVLISKSKFRFIAFVMWKLRCFCEFPGLYFKKMLRIGSFKIWSIISRYFSPSSYSSKDMVSKERLVIQLNGTVGSFSTFSTVSENEVA